MSRRLEHDILDSRDLAERLEELEDELVDLKDAIAEAEEELNECEEEEEQETLADTLNEAAAALEDWEKENAEELEELRNLADEVPDWRHGAMLISEGYFVEYAQDLAEDLGMDRNQPWPYSCIDWLQAADELKQDYTSIEYQGETYWFRS